MTSSLLIPRKSFPRKSSPPSESLGSRAATESLDWRHPIVVTFSVGAALVGGDEIAMLQRAHSLIVSNIKPVYALDDLQPVSRTIALGRGSCSQRFGILEAVARSAGIETRTRGLLVQGRFWHQRFPWARWAIPDIVVLPWPEFFIDGAWKSTSDLFSRNQNFDSGRGFENCGRETLFDAVSQMPFSWSKADRLPVNEGRELNHFSNFVVRQLGTFESREDLFASAGHTLSPLAQSCLNPVFSRWSPGQD